MSQLTYNNITLPYPTTTSFRQEVVYDDVSQTDVCVIKFDIQVSFLISLDYLGTIAPQYANSDVTNPAGVLEVIRTDLLRPRKALSFVVNGQELIPQRTFAQAGTTDAKNGPQPQRCDITMLTNSCFVMNYHIVAHYWEKYDLAGPGDVDVNENLPSSYIMYNRWSETVEIDNCDMSRRIREGKYMIRSNNEAAYTADLFRSQLAVIGVPEGFLRESKTYTVAPDGLGMTYRVVDREVFKYPPAPAYEAKGNYIETATMQGALRYGEVRLFLKGAKTTPQHRLLAVAMQVVGAKLNINGAKVMRTNNGGYRFNHLQFASVNVGMYENTVEVTARVQLVAKPQTFQGFPFNGAMVVTPGSDFNLIGSETGTNATNYTVPYKDRGTASLLLQAAAYIDPDITGLIEMPGKVGTTRDNPDTPQGEVNMNMKGLVPGEAGRLRERTA